MVMLMSILGVHFHPQPLAQDTALLARFSFRPRQWGRRSAQCLLEFPKKEMLTNNSTTYGFSEVGLGEVSSPRTGAGVGSSVR